MAIGWLTVLKMVPWTDVVKNAPVVADGAKKLWSTVAKKPAVPDPNVVVPEPPVHSPAAEAPSIGALRARVTAAETAAAGLQQQLLESTELIKNLAEQNIQLVERVEANRIRVLWLAAFTAVTAVVAAIGVTLALVEGAA